MDHSVYAKYVIISVDIVDIVLLILTINEKYSANL